STTSTYSYASYPSIIAEGSHFVSINITVKCGAATEQSGWIATKTLTVNSDPNNLPPNFQVGWTIPGQWTVSGVRTTVAVGTTLDLVYLDIPAPEDPDGDPFQF